MTTIFRDRRNNGERRSTREFAGRIHCRRRSKDRRRYRGDSEGKRWWLQTNYVDKEVQVDKPTK